MTDYNITVGKDLLPELLSNQDGLAKLVEGVLNQVLEAQLSESLGADKHERCEERVGYRNGYRPRQLYTRNEYCSVWIYCNFDSKWLSSSKLQFF